MKKLTNDRLELVRLKERIKRIARSWAFNALYRGGVAVVFAGGFRMMGDLEWRMMQVGNWLIALICGSMGVFCLWYSFSAPKLALDAAGFLALAIVLEFANHFLLRAKRR